MRTIFFTRLPVLAALLVLLSGLAVGLHRYHNLPSAWAWVGAPALAPSFTDTRTITHSIDAVRSGRDTYVDRSFDPLHRLYNYPPIWLELRYLGVSAKTTEWVGGAFGAAFFCSCFALFRARNWVTGAIIFLALLSWPVLFALERGNSDLLIFAILTSCSLWLARGGRPVSSPKQTSLIVVLTILKIYPVVTVLAMARNRRAARTAFAAGLLALVALLATSGPRLFTAIRNTPTVTFLSFGSFPFSMWLGMRNHWPIAIGLAATGLVIGCLRNPIISRLPEIDLQSARGFLAAAGLIIYAFVFFAGGSFDYRLIFLLCPLMYLIENLNERLTVIPLSAALVLVAFLFRARVSPRASKELLGALLFVGACAWITDTLRRSLGPDPLTRFASTSSAQQRPSISGANA